MSYSVEDKNSMRSHETDLRTGPSFRFDREQRPNWFAYDWVPAAQSKSEKMSPEDMLVLRANGWRFSEILAHDL
jgi:hypothetical protein